MESGEFTLPSNGFGDIMASSLVNSFGGYYRTASAATSSAMGCRGLFIKQVNSFRLLTPTLSSYCLTFVMVLRQMKEKVRLMWTISTPRQPPLFFPSKPKTWTT